MSTPVPVSPQSSQLENMCVGRPVSARHGARWVQQIAHLAGRQVHRVCSHTLSDLQTATSAARTVRLTYLRSFSAQVALLAVELRKDDQLFLGGATIPVGARAVLSCTLPAGAAWIDQGPFDGATEVPLPSPVSIQRRWCYALVDVSAVSSAGDFVITISSVGGPHRGIATVHLAELPLATLRPEDGEPGLQLSWPDPRNPLEEGVGAPPLGPTGLSAVVELEQRLATLQRWWWQIATYEDAAESWLSANTGFGALDWRGALGTAYSPIWRTRIRRLYTSTYRCRARVRYLSVLGATLRLRVTPVGGTPVDLDVTLPPSAVWSWATAPVLLPTTGVAQAAEIEVLCNGTANLSTVAIYSEEIL